MSKSRRRSHKQKAKFKVPGWEHEVQGVAPQVSVLLRVRKGGGSTVGDALDSALHQVGDVPLEIIIGTETDDLSLQELRARIHTLPVSCRILDCGKPLSALSNQKRLLQAATAPLSAWLDAEDVWSSKKLAAQLAFMNRHLDCAAVLAQAEVVDTTGKVIGVLNNVGNRWIYRSTLARSGCFIARSSLLFRTALREGLLELPLDFSLPYQMAFALAGTSPLGHLGIPLVKQRQGVNQEEELQARWRLLSSMNLPLDNKMSSSAEFLTSVASIAVSTRSSELFKDWLHEVLQSFPQNRYKLWVRFWRAMFSRGVTSGLANHLLAFSRKHTAPTLYKVRFPSRALVRH